MPIKAALPCPVVSPNNCLPAVMPKSLCLKCHALLGKGLQSQLFQAFGDKTLPTASARHVTPRPRNLNLPQHPDGQSNCKDIRKVHMATQHTKQMPRSVGKRVRDDMCSKWDLLSNITKARHQNHHDWICQTGGGYIEQSLWHPAEL